MPTPSTGSILLYRLSADDLADIQNRFTNNPGLFSANPPSVGDVVPLVVVRVWPDEYGPGVPGVNGQAMLDGNAQHWVTSRGEGTGPGQWSWPTVTA